MARLVLAHGFTQTGASFAPLVDALGGDDDVVAPDLPGHGPRPAEPLDLGDAAARLGRAGGRATYLGYSLGGRVALHLALARPDLVDGLVLVGATAGLEGAGERAARRAADEDRARSLEAGGLDAFLDAWLAQPLFAGLAPAAAGLGDRRRNTVAGLAAALRRLGLGTQEPLWDQLARLSMPVLAMAGEHDHRYRALAARLAAAVGPNATTATIAGTGHACHLEDPAAVAAALTQWRTA